MADAAGTAQEEHGRGHAASHDHGVVPGAARHGFGGKAGGFDRVRHEGGEALIHRHGGLVHLLRPFELQSATRRDGLGLLQAVRRRRLCAALSCTWRTSRLSSTDPGNYVASVGLHFHLADRGNKAFGADAQALRPSQSTPRQRRAHRGAGASAWCRRGWHGR